MIAEDVKDDICTGRGKVERGEQGGRWEAKREEGAERIAGVFCSTPVCLKDESLWETKRQRARQWQRRGCTQSRQTQTL